MGRGFRLLFHTDLRGGQDEFPTTLVAGEELGGSDKLTWGAIIVQSLAKSTCPERAKMMTLRKEVNHITHSKSATS